MGTNYYWYEKADCECCGRPFEPIHIGKSSGGWCFSLHIYPDDNIHTLDDWKSLWYKPGSFIRNEYGEKILIEEMLKTITERSWRGRDPMRHEVDGCYCIGHGPGTYDYLIGEFS